MTVVLVPVPLSMRLSLDVYKRQSVSSHKRFEEKYGLAFTLLADPERKVIEAYDVWKEKNNYGKVSMGVVRTTYLIDEQGIICLLYTSRCV